MYKWEISVVTLLFSTGLCSITIIDGEYSGITVGLHSNLFQSECEKIVQSLENMFLSGSSVLSEATSGLSFGAISVVIPDTWDKCGSYSVNNAEGYMTWDSSTLRVGEVHPLFGHEPWTQQPRGCGQEGDFISMTSVWLLSTAYTDEYRGSRLVHEWAKYRWGVFEEYGHFGDPIFPESFRLSSGSWSPNYCTNEDLNGGFQSECSESQDCVFVIQNSPEVNSSLMAVPDPELTSVTQFCNSSNHKADLPTKQNLLCNHLSTWDVIMNHSDLSRKILRKTASRGSKALVVTVLRENAANSLVIAFETSTTMDKVINRFNFEKESIAQFVMYEAPSSAEVGIVSFVATAQTVYNLYSLQDTTTRKNIAAKVLDISASSNAAAVDLKLPIEKSAQMLSAGNGIILLITKCTEEGISYTAGELASAADGHPVWMILYPTTTQENLVLFNDLAMMTGGKVIVIEDELVQDLANKYISPNVRLSLSQAFRQFLHSNPTFDVQQLDYATCEKTESPCIKELVVPRGFNEEVILYVYKDSGDVIAEDTSSIVVQGGFCGPLQHFGDSEGNVKTTEVVLCSVEENKSSSLTVEVERDRGSAILLLELAGRPVYEESGFELRFFGTSDLYDLRYTNLTAPAIFAQILYTDVRVLFANISAVVSFASMRENSYDRIYLRDDGTGADVTGNDGIYSAYLVPVIPVGLFSISLSADDNAGASRLTPTTFDSGNPYTCCGSSIPLPDSDSLETVPAFSSSVPLISAAITGAPSDLNLPPGIIKDLTYVQQQSSQAITVSFTATGEDLDYGTADHYVLKQINGDETDWEEITLSHTPLSSGSREIFTLEDIECDTKTTFLINAVDGSEKRGGDSNRIIVYLTCVEGGGGGGLTAGALTGIVISCIALLIIIIIIICIAYRQKFSEDEREKHLKMNSCSCCDDESEGEFYNTFTGNNDNRPPVKKIRTIEDLDLNLDDQDLPANNQSTDNDSSYLGSRAEVNGSSQGSSWDRKGVADPNEGFVTDSFQFAYFQKTRDSVSSLNSHSESPFVSQHSINQVGIPVTKSPPSYSDRTTLAAESISANSSRQNTPKQYRHNTQV